VLVGKNCPIFNTQLGVHYSIINSFILFYMILHLAYNCRLNYLIYFKESNFDEE